jgi:ankyrin repeat protein
MLILRGAHVNEPDSDGEAPLHRMLPYFSVAKLLVEVGANVNVANNNGSTPLLEACRLPDGLETKPLRNAFSK